jgi:hypothetical protein
MVERSAADLLGPELVRAVAREITIFAERLARQARGEAAAVLFYGSALRDQALDGLLDFYVLVDRVEAWPGSRLAALANRVLPPHVGYAEEEIDGLRLRAKYAVMTLARFGRAMSAQSFDTTLWARFSQPCACVYARSETDFEQVRCALASGCTTAAYWAAVLGPAQGEPPAYWNALYTCTYELELRVESSDRSDSIVAHAPARYRTLLAAAWRGAGIEFQRDGEVLRPLLDAQVRRASLRRWRLRSRLGRPLNILRLLKAALTFERGVDYVLWKVERHSGVRLAVANWERRFPLLAAPGIYYRLRRRGLLR